MYQITRKLEFDAGHRVLNHEGKCKHLHGHRYVVELTVRSTCLDDKGRVVDFGTVKSIVGSWIDENLDHNMILNPDDPLVAEGFLEFEGGTQRDIVSLVGRAPYIMPDEYPNPTAENIARLIYETSTGLLRDNKDIKVTSVRVWETPNCNALYPVS